MNEFGKALMGMIRVMDRTIARKISSGILTLTLAAIVLLVAAGSASADTLIDHCNFEANVDDEYYYLDSDLDCEVLGAGEYGIKVTASDVIIDGRGNSINATVDALACEMIEEQNPEDGVCGILVYRERDNIIIKDLEVKDFCTGIGIKGMATARPVTNVTVTNCSIHDNGVPGAGSSTGTTHGIHMVFANDCTIKKSSIVGNKRGGFGMDTLCDCGSGGNGVYLYKSSDNTITCNNLCDNEKAGIFMKKGSSRNKILYNNASGNGHSGVCIRCKMSNENEIEYNNASYNKGSGIFIRGQYNIVRYNTVLNNVNGSDYVDICHLGDPAYEVAQYGVGIKGSPDTIEVELYNNTVCENEVYDIEDPVGGRFTGDDNTCNTTSKYNDTGTTGCTYDCPGVTDLIISDKYEQWYGDIYNVIYTITNLGHSTAGDSTTGIYIDGILNKTDPVGLLGPGESYVRTVGPFTMSGENDIINVCADNDDTIDETNEDNNCLENVFDGVMMPDFVITEKSEEWVDFESKTYNITYSIKNIGNTDANESTTAIMIDGTEAATDPVGALPFHATHTAELGPFTMSGESDTIRVCADNESDVTESNEDNNYLENIFGHPGIPDLVIIRKHEEWVASNETYHTYNITYTIENVGTGDANESTTAIIIDGVEVATDPVEALGEGDSYTSVLGPFTMSDESDTIKVCADNESAVDESNEENNCLENTFEHSEIGCVAEDGTLFRCGNIVTKNCTFNGNLACLFTHGLKIGADNITIAGNNSVLDGVICVLDEFGFSRSGIYNPGYDDVMIEDLEVKGFCNGIYLKSGGVGEGNVYRNTIEHCDVHHNGNASTTTGIFGIKMLHVYNSTIRNNTVHHQIAGVNPNPGCEDGGNGMFLYKGWNNNITENKVYNNTKGGIFIKMQPMHNNISHNDLWDNGQGGIILRCMMSNYNLIEHNNASNNYGSGIFIGARENTIRYNTVCDNRDGGPYYQDSVGGHGYGINLGRSDGSYNNYLYDNEICGNDYADVCVVPGVTGNHGVNNTCDTTDNYNDNGTTGCTYPCGGGGTCGDVDGLPGVTTNDGRQIFMYLLHGPGEYPLADTWAADCDGLCDGITTNDGRHIFMHLLHDDPEHPENDQYPLNCSC